MCFPSEDIKFHNSNLSPLLTPNYKSFSSWYWSHLDLKYDTGLWTSSGILIFTRPAHLVWSSEHSNRYPVSFLHSVWRENIFLSGDTMFARLSELHSGWLKMTFDHPPPKTAKSTHQIWNLTKHKGVRDLVRPFPMCNFNIRRSYIPGLLTCHVCNPFIYLPALSNV